MGLSRKKTAVRKKESVGAGVAAKRVHKKVPGFDAFSKVKAVPQVVKKRGRKGKKVKLVAVEDVDEPETGIHSLEWAQAIVPQPDCGFLKLPYEVRLKIYRHVIDDFTIWKRKDDFAPVEPRKRGLKFQSYTWDDPAADTERLYMICRQSYVDVVGSGLLYQTVPFGFTSPKSMLNYLLVIHPVHKDAIRSVDIKVTVSSPPKIFQPLACSTLASMPNLQHLTLRIAMHRLLFTRTVIPGGWYVVSRVFHSVKQKMLDNLVTCEQLVGNGKRDNEGGEGGIRGLLSLNLYLTSSDGLDLMEGEREKFASVEEALRRVMVKSS